MPGDGKPYDNSSYVRTVSAVYFADLCRLGIADALVYVLLW
ncbi:hypothetical protein [Spirosoma profusum]|nr:hypothetical protein [Spirosoma profusum]